MVQNLLTRWRKGSYATRSKLVGSTFLVCYLIYIAANRLLISDGENDPIYRLLGIERRDQSFSVLSMALIGCAAWAVSALHRSQLIALTQTPKGQRALVALVALFFANAGVSSIAGISADMNGRFLIPLYGWVALILGAQLALCALALSRIQSTATNIILLTALGVLSLYALNFSLAQWFRTEGLPFKIFSLMLSGWLVAGVFIYAARSFSTWKTVFGVLLLTFFAPLVAAIYDGLGTSDRAVDPLQRFASINLSSTPDIHILSLDALAPPELAATYLDLDSVAYNEALLLPGVHRFSNAFSTHVPTKWALNSVMRLAQADFPPRLDYFVGQRNSPLATLLHANGYRVETGFPIVYMGVKGEYVDDYRPDPSSAVSNSALCILADSSLVAFYGFCKIGEILDEPSPTDPWNDQVVEIMRGFISRAEGPPIFSYHHLLKPIGHTSLDYQTGNRKDEAEFRRAFVTNDAHALDFLSQIKSLRWESGRPTIVIVKGDHGLWVSRTVSVEEDANFFVQDRHGIVLASLVNRTVCTPSELDYFAADYATPERILGGLFRCLAENPEQVDQALNFSEPFPFRQYRYQ